MPQRRRAVAMSVTAALVLASLVAAPSAATDLATSGGGPLAAGPSATAATGWAMPARPAVVAATAKAAFTKKVIGNGTPSSCTYAKLAKAVRSGGDIRFNCGPKKHTIVVTKTLVTCNTTTCKHPWQDSKAKIVQKMRLNGGNKVTLSGGNKVPIFYANACEESFGWLTSACQNDVRPHVVFKNIRMVRGNATKPPAGYDGVGHGGGGGAIVMRAGRLTVQNSTFRLNKCMKRQSDGGGGAIRAVGMRKAVRITKSTFDKNKCANGGAVSSLHAPLWIRSSTFTNNQATGTGASSGQGGNGGAIYFDGTKQNVRIERTTITGNRAPEGGPGVFYVSNDRSGSLTISNSTVTNNTGARFWTGKTKSIFYLGKKFTKTKSKIT